MSKNLFVTPDTSAPLATPQQQPPAAATSEITVVPPAGIATVSAPNTPFFLRDNQPKSKARDDIGLTPLSTPCSFFYTAPSGIFPQGQIRMLGLGKKAIAVVGGNSSPSLIGQSGGPLPFTLDQSNTDQPPTEAPSLKNLPRDLSSTFRRRPGGKPKQRYRANSTGSIPPATSPIL